MAAELMTWKFAGLGILMILNVLLLAYLLLRLVTGKDFTFKQFSVGVADIVLNIIFLFLYLL